MDADNTRYLSVGDKEDPRPYESGMHRPGSKPVIPG
jgi:hypothetical protein